MPRYCTEEDNPTYDKVISGVALFGTFGVRWEKISTDMSVHQYVRKFKLTRKKFHILGIPSVLFLEQQFLPENSKTLALLVRRQIT